MTIDAVGGVWRYGMDLARALVPLGHHVVFLGLGPPPSHPQRAEADAIGPLVWTDAPLDWTTRSPDPLEAIPAIIAEQVARHGIDLVQLNVPSQAAGLALDVPTVAVAHSCVPTWFATVRRTGLPAGWAWHKTRNRRGLDAVDLVVAPSRAHADQLVACYGPIDGLHVVHNGSQGGMLRLDKEAFVYAGGRWWDEGKNGRVLDLAARQTSWPIVMAGAQRGPDGQYLAIEYAQAVGERSYGEVRALMDRAAILVSPSLYEPFGLTPLEGAGAGAALVLADIPTYRELWDDAALFADPRDPAQFASAIDTLMADPEARRGLARKAGARAATYTVAAQAQAMAGHYARLLARHAVELAR